MTHNDRVPPGSDVHSLDLPLTSLHYVRCGAGTPLIIVPATISLIEDWLSLVQFMGQRFEAHFFELPGHGESAPFVEPFRSELVAETVGHLADALGFERFTLMGFSFGGILTMKTLRMHAERIDRLVLLSPCVAHEALKHSPVARNILRATMGALRTRPARASVLKLIHDPHSVNLVAWFMQNVGKYETAADLRARLRAFSESTIDVLISQVREILSVKADELAGVYDIPCVFGMSRNDPLIDYEMTREVVSAWFPELTVEEWDFDYHAPPEPLTFEQLNTDYRGLLDAYTLRE